MKYALVFANGDIADGPFVQSVLSQAVDPLVVAADGGARVAAHFGLKVDVVLGDLDSLTSDEVNSLAESGARIERYSPEKDFTDLELALTYVSEHQYDWIRVIGGIGRRIDQTFGNVYLLALEALKGRDVRMVAGKQEIYLLNAGTYTITGQPDDTVSLIPMGGAAYGIHTDALYYPLKGETLNFGPARGISNVMTGHRASVTIGEGTLLLVHTMGRA